MVMCREVIEDAAAILQSADPILHLNAFAFEEKLCEHLRG